MSVEDLMHANLMGVFNERDPDRRRTAIETTYAAGVRFVEGDETTVGHEALAAKVQRLLDRTPDFVFRASGPVRVVQDLGYLAWDFGPEGEDPVVRGADIALVTDDRITSVHTMLLTQ